MSVFTAFLGAVTSDEIRDIFLWLQLKLRNQSWTGEISMRFPVLMVGGSVNLPAHPYKKLDFLERKILTSASQNFRNILDIQ
jgi:hypothetical protein